MRGSSWSAFSVTLAATIDYVPPKGAPPKPSHATQTHPPSSLSALAFVGAWFCCAPRARFSGRSTRLT